MTITPPENEYFKDMLLNGTHLSSFEDKLETCNIVSENDWFKLSLIHGNIDNTVGNPFLTDEKLNHQIAPHFSKFMCGPVALDEGICIVTRSFKYDNKRELFDAVENGISKYLYAIYITLKTDPKTFTTSTTYTLRVGYILQEKT